MPYVAPTTTTAITAGTTAGLFTFASPMTSIVINNESGQNAFILFDVTVGAVVAASGIGIKLADGESLAGICTEWGKSTVTTVSVWLETGATTSALKIHGTQL